MRLEVLIAAAVGYWFYTHRSTPSPSPEVAAGDALLVVKAGDAMDVALQAAAHAAGIHSEVLEAIERHETGNYTSELWHKAHNPGGMVYRPTLKGLGHNYGYLERKDAGKLTKFAKFPDDALGIGAHGAFLAQKRYNAARRTDDAYAQVDAIAAAGYAADKAWSRKVRAIVKSLRLKRGLEVQA